MLPAAVVGSLSRITARADEWPGAPAEVQEQARSQAEVSENPVNWTPHITDGRVWAMGMVGGTVIVGGDFSSTTHAHSRSTIHRRNLMAFRLSDGKVTDLRVDLDGPVWALAEGPDGSVFVGGDFTTVNGHRRRSLARVDVTTGEVSPHLRTPVDGDVRTLAVHGRHLYVGGSFDRIGDVRRSGLARLDLADGQVDPDFDAELAKPVRTRPRVESMALSPDGASLVAIGNFAQARGQARHQLVMLDVTGPQAVVSEWHTEFYRTRCSPRFDTYLRGIDFAPDGSYFVVVTTGHDSGSPELPCNAAARFEAYGSGEHPPTWVNHTGGHSLYAVEATGPAVYVGGHQRWQDNPYGVKHKGPGAVDRSGIAALDPETGRALDWNPTRSRGQGVRAFVRCPQGLLVGSDTDELGHEYHARIGLFPTA
ncbi:delta-60 repeat domain-containing protein [Catellatospora paridis]|uniref:delta-60 repeat domain-containing protein n=1 Tax=Catellatospora paridis TaxID=1617086 RepID=UPI001E5280E5|nr:delta-60 repeat domain-containing protein [Catellatospora paridis]